MKVFNINKDKTDLDDIGFGINRLHKGTKEQNKVCNSCDKLAVKEVRYQVGDSNQKATRIERYCQKTQYLHLHLQQHHQRYQHPDHKIQV